MQKRFYLDTCIWRDLLEDRKSGYSFLGENAFQFLKNCRKFECVVLCSDLVINELRGYFSNSEIDSLLEPFLDLLLFVDYTKEETLEVPLILNKFKGIHFADILHALIARDNNSVLVTRDKHFELLNEIVISLKPEQVRFD